MDTARERPLPWAETFAKMMLPRHRPPTNADQVARWLTARRDWARAVLEAGSIFPAAEIPGQERLKGNPAGRTFAALAAPLTADERIDFGIVQSAAAALLEPVEVPGVHWAPLADALLRLHYGLALRQETPNREDAETVRAANLKRLRGAHKGGAKQRKSVSLETARRALDKVSAVAEKMGTRLTAKDRRREAARKLGISVSTLDRVMREGRT